MHGRTCEPAFPPTYAPPAPSLFTHPARMRTVGGPDPADRPMHTQSGVLRSSGESVHHAPPCSGASAAAALCVCVCLLAARGGAAARLDGRSGQPVGRTYQRQTAGQPPNRPHEDASAPCRRRPDAGSWRTCFVVRPKHRNKELAGRRARRVLLRPLLVGVCMPSVGSTAWRTTLSMSERPGQEKTALRCVYARVRACACAAAQSANRRRGGKRRQARSSTDLRMPFVFHDSTVSSLHSTVS